MIPLFVLRLSAGIAGMWLLMPRKEVTDGFFRIQMLVVLGLAVLAALLLSSGSTWPVSAPAGERVGQHSESGTQASVAGQQGTSLARSVAERIRWGQIAIAVVAWIGHVVWKLGRRIPGNSAVWTVACVALGCLLLHAVEVPSPAGRLHQVLANLSSAAVLGATLTGMLLGHWYLTSPTMSIRPLWWFTAVVGLAGLLRLTLSGAALLRFGFEPVDTASRLWLGLRWFGGGIVPLVIAVSVWRILRYRNTQSATGVLFAGLILVFMGEMAAGLLERATRLPY